MKGDRRDRTDSFITLIFHWPCHIRTEPSKIKCIAKVLHLLLTNKEPVHSSIFILVERVSFWCPKFANFLTVLFWKKLQNCIILQLQAIHDYCLHEQILVINHHLSVAGETSNENLTYLAKVA